MQSLNELKRLGLYKLPRSVLLPPYLLLSPYFKEYSDAIDSVFGSSVDEKTRVLQNIRNMWVTNPKLEQDVLNQLLINFDKWSAPERALVVQQVNMLGMKLKSSGALSNEDYLRISRFLGQYWYEKGTYSFIEFINFCSNADLKVYKMWSQRPSPEDVEASDSLGYYNLTREDEQGNPPGTPMYEGGDWFPTTHVEIENRNGKTNLDVLTLAEFFYEIANYNLVLNAIDNARDMVVTDTLGNNKTEIVAVAGVLDKVVVMSNFGRYGATPPPLVDLTPDKPVQCYGDGELLLTAPNSWYLDSEGRKLLVYSMEHRQEKDNGSIPTQVTGNFSGSEASEYIVLTGPIEYINIPGAARTQAQIPVWRAEPTVGNTQSLPTNYVGAGYSIVANPTGWYEIQPGLFTPYWE